MNKIKNADFLTTFPPALKQDETMLALGRLIAEELHITAEETEKNIIYANIDTLSETWLDILAYDLHVDWYNYDYPIEAKRAIIKDSVRVHQKLGTKAAVEMALGGIHPQSEIEEWFNYGGKPYRFRIVLDTTHSRVEADYEEIVKTVDIYKRLTAHLDGLYYQCSMCVVIMPRTEYFLFSTPMTGQIKAGTEPYRSTVGAIADTVISINAKAAGYLSEAVRTGTKPDRNILFESAEAEAVGETELETYVFENALVGTNPKRNIVFAGEDIETTADTETENYVYTVELTGRTVAGTKPETSTIPGISEKGMTTTADTESYQYEVKRCGASRLSK